MARGDATIDRDGETCDMCFKIILGAQVGREGLEAGAYQDIVVSPLVRFVCDLKQTAARPRPGPSRSAT